MDEILEAYGCRLNLDILSSELEKSTSKQITQGTKNFFESVAPFLVMAYDMGKRGQSLNNIFPFMDEVK